MSDLEELCDALNAINGDILQTSRELHSKAQAYNRASAQAAAAARSAEGEAGAALARTAAALAAASQHCSRAAQSLVGASSEGQAFVRRTVGGAKAGSSPGQHAGAGSPNGLGHGDGPIETGDEPTLTQAATGYSDASARPVEPTHIGIDTARQGAIGDCFLIASLCAVAKDDPSLLQGMVQQTETGFVVHAATDCYISHSLPTGNSAANSHGDVYGYSDDGATMVPIVEKAYAQRVGGYDVLGKGGYPEDALEWLTGRPAFARATSGANDSEIRGILSRKSYVVAQTRTLGAGDSRIALAEHYGVVTGAHAYVVRGVTDDDHVLLHNPWGWSHPTPVPLKDFQTLFPWVSFC